MANIFVKGAKLAATALALLRKEVKAPALFTYRFGVADFKGAEGDTVGVKRPPVLVARDKGWRNDDAIIIDRLVNTKIQVTLNKHPYSAIALSPEEEALDEIDYVRDVQVPQVQALLDWFENLVIGALRGAAFTLGVTFNTASSVEVEKDPRKVAIRARKLFQQAHVPAAGRYWLVGSDVSEALASYDKLLDVDVSGLPEALRDGVVGKLGGFIIVELDSLAATESFFVHESAIAIATVAPVVPQGVTKGGGVAAGFGLAVTQLWDYDSSLLKDRSIVHALAGATPVGDPEVDSTGAVYLDEDGAPVLKFLRGIKVTFGAGGAEVPVYTLQITGVPTGGTFTLTADGEVTDAIAYNATNATIAAELNEVAGISGAKVSGTSTKTITFKERVVLTGDGALLTGGTTPDAVVTAV